MNYFSGKKANLQNACRALAAAAFIAGLASCDAGGLLSQPSALRDEQYSQTSISHAVLEGAYGNHRTPTVDEGVHELQIRGLTRVDSGGPNFATTAPTTGPTSRPEAGGIYTIADADNVGLAPAQLEMPEPVKDLTLQDAIYRTSKHSLAIKVEAYNPAIKESQIIEAAAALDPVFFGASQWTNTDEPPLIASQQGFTNGQNWQNQVGIRRLLPTGGQVQASVTDTWRLIDTAGVPAATSRSLGNNRTSYTANINLTLTQPLLRGFGRAVTEANIYLAQRDYRISLSEFKQRVIGSMADVEEAYQNLVLARTNVDVLKRLVVATEQTYRIVWERRGIDATKASIAQALQAVWTRRADLLDAQKAYRAASDRLKSLMNDPDFDVQSNVLVNPVDKPVAEPVFYDVDDNIDLALQQRPEMQQARLQVERADIVVKVAHNGLLPRLDLTVGLQSNGINHGFDGAIGGTLDPMNNIDYNAGVKFEIPLGNREAASILRRRLNERKQALENLLQVAQKIVLDVRTQTREVKSTYASLELRDFARQAAADEFEGILEIEDIQKRSPEFLQLKLDSQARLASAEQQLIQSLVNYNLAIMRLEQAKGTLLEFDRISMDRPPTEPDDGLTKLRFLGETYEKNEKKK